MKKQLFTIACLLLSLTILAQEETRKLTPSIKLGAGIWTQDIFYVNMDLGVQAEYKFTDRFSIYGNVSFNQSLDLYYFEDHFNFVTFLAGPRLYLSNSFFTGVGAGYLQYLGNDYYSGGGFAFSPHIGFDRPKTQWTLNYTANTEGGVYGYISLAAAFKLGTK
jgi:hypothetical protein